MTREFRDERRWANTDPSVHANHSEPQKPDWRSEYVRLLKARDYDAAEQLKSQNMISDECANEDCSECHFAWCRCSRCHSAVQFREQHPQLVSLREASREEEAAA